jgi:ADP-ribose pyrophosphatase YjhB (NUDIX family)
MIPHTHFHFCPKCGGGKILPIQEHGVRCTNCGYVYYHNSAAAVSALLETPGGIVLIERQLAPKRGYYDLPGGFVGHGESLEEALAREVREELKVEVENPVYLGSFPNVYPYKRVTYFTTDAFFVCRAVSLRPMTANEEIGRISIREPGRINLAGIAFDSARKAIRLYRKSRKGISP